MNYYLNIKVKLSLSFILFFDHIIYFFWKFSWPLASFYNQ